MHFIQSSKKTAVNKTLLVISTERIHLRKIREVKALQLFKKTKEIRYVLDT